MDWFTILIVLLFIVFPLIQQMLEARNRGNAPPPEDSEGYPEGYGEGGRGDEPLGLPEGWQWEWEQDESSEEEVAEAPVPVATRRAPEQATRIPEHVARERGSDARPAPRMPEHVPRPRVPEPTAPARIPETPPRPRAPEPVAAPRIPEHVPRPRAPEPAQVRRTPETAPPVVVSLETLDPIWAGERTRRDVPPLRRARRRDRDPAESLAKLLKGQKELRRAILLAEVLGPPRALRSDRDDDRIPGGPI